MNQTIKIIIIAVAAAIVGGGLVIGGMKLAGGTSKSAKTTQGSNNFWDTVPTNNQAVGTQSVGGAQAGIPTAPAHQGAQTGGAQIGAGGQVGAAPAPTQTAPAPKPVATQPAPTQQNTGGSDVDSQVRRLLTSYTWCSYSYSGTSTYTGGYGDSSSSSRVVFNANGVVTFSSSSESYNSGGYGTAYGSGGDSVTGNWKVQGGQLYLSSADTGGQWVNTNATLSQNSNGYPIITAGGVEYYTCN